jgi:hypothetical protein
LSRVKGGDLAKVLARKAEGDAKVARKETGVDLPPGADWLDDLSIYAVPLRYADLLDAEALDRAATIALIDEVGEWASASLQSSRKRLSSARTSDAWTA